MRHTLYLFIISLCLFSCAASAEYEETLRQVESYIEERPDSALAVLQGIDGESLVRASDKAKHALLLSMALDKNYIDRTDFETIQPALDYYESHGSPTDQLRTHYYQGRIFQNRNDEGSAMNAYLVALEKGLESDDMLTKARLYVAQGNIYDSLMEWEKCVEANLAAAEIFKNAGKTGSYVNCILKAVVSYIHLDDNENCERYLELCRKYLNDIPLPILGNYYSIYLTYLADIDDKEMIRRTIDEYVSEVPESIINHLSLAHAYLQLEEYGKAQTEFSKSAKRDNSKQKMKYYAVMQKMYDKTGNHEKALEAYEKFVYLTDSVTLAIIRQDTQFIEERHALEMKTAKEHESKNMILLWSIIIVIVLTATVIYVRSRLKIKTMETDKYKLLYQQIEDERDNLSELLSKNGDLDSDAKAAVASRLDLLNRFFTAYITDNSEINRKVTKELEDLLADKENFMSSTEKAFAGSHPRFIKYLEDHNLTENEIQYCCLYALGLKGKEVGAYLKMRGHYNISSEVRAKLGLGENDTNLGIYIRKLLKTLE